MKTIFNIPALFLAVLIFSQKAQSQLIDHVSTGSQINSPGYFRFHYDNDFFTKTDYYYSQGINLELASKGLKSISGLTSWHRCESCSYQYGLALDLFAFTPTSIESDSILFNDRPYAAAITLTNFTIASNTDKGYRLSNSFTMGVLGPNALGKPIQTEIHRALENELPLGWQYQIKNDLILNYKIGFEKRLTASNEHFLLSGLGRASIGTLNTDISAGFSFMVGNFSDPYHSSAAPRKKVEYFLYGRGFGKLVAYDASIQGGLLNRNSPYTISSGNIARAIAQADAGIVLNIRPVYLCYSQSITTKAFKTARSHRWGGITFGFSF